MDSRNPTNPTKAKKTSKSAKRSNPQRWEGKRPNSSPAFPRSISSRGSVGLPSWLDDEPLLLLLLSADGETIVCCEKNFTLHKGMFTLNVGFCIVIISYFSSSAQVKPTMMSTHAITLAPYLESFDSDTASDNAIINDVTSILESVIPLMEHPSESFLSEVRVFRSHLARTCTRT